jgi:MPBQ/MSBQ methyltransferase
MEMVIDPLLHRSIVEYYAEAGMDYGTWSPSFNMHFGFGTIGKLFRREEMLNQMSDEVMARLRLSRNQALIGDFGCGVGATMRRAATRNRNATFIGLTIVPWQKSKGEALNLACGADERVQFVLSDFHNPPMRNESLDGVYAIESACYSPEHLHSRLIRESHRVLKTDGRIVIADGFLKTPLSEMSSCLTRMFHGICRNWSLPGMMNIHELEALLLRGGFHEIKIEEVSWRVAPSVMHVPFVITWFIVSKLLRGEKLSRQSIRNLKGAFLTLILGLHRRNFGYYIVSATKR